MKIFGKRGSTGVVGALILGIVGLIVVEQFLNNVTFSSALVNTIKPYLVPLGFVGLIALSIKMGRR